MKKTSNRLDGLEKERLKRSIMASIHGYQTRRNILRYSSIAASIMLAIGVCFMGFQRSSAWFEESLTSYGDVNLKSGAVTLYVADDKQITSDSDSVHISYSTSGRKIQLSGAGAAKDEEVQIDEVTYQTLIVPYGKRTQIALSDGTSVFVNSGSRLIYPNKFTGDTREVFLEGEAIFKVKEDVSHPFVVQARNHKVRVLGTEFCLSSYPEDPTIQTVLKSGRVAIDYEGDALFESARTVQITPGMLATFDKEAAEVKTRQVNVDRYFSWQNGVFIFKNDPFSLIMRRISRYYGIEIILEKQTLRDERFSGYLDLKERMDQVLRNIGETTSFSFQYINDETIVITN